MNDTTDRTQSLGRFLASVELRAFRIARASLRHDDDALDAVQVGSPGTELEFAL